MTEVTEAPAANPNPTRDQLISGLVSAMANPLRSPILRTPAEDGLAYSDVFFPAMDGVTIEGWFIPADSDRLIIANHPIWANRYGFPGHLKPYSDAWEASGNNIEVNFMPDYKHLHDAGYNILTYDLRNFGQSAAGSGGAIGNGIREYRDVIGSLRYVRSRSDLNAMKIGLLSRCCGMNATMVGMAKHREEFILPHDPWSHGHVGRSPGRGGSIATGHKHGAEGHGHAALCQGGGHSDAAPTGP
jgi:hypothetical protein